MKVLIISLVAFFSVSSVEANEITRYEKSFCSKRQSKSFAQASLKSSRNWLAFRNQGGLLNAGVCWWHSRFTRKALYLAIYRPDLQRPTSSQAKRIIKDIRLGKITIVPGFENLNSFSYAFANEIQDRLEKWQVGDGFMRQQWLVGLWGTSKSSAAALKKRMDSLYTEVNIKKNVTYQVLQLKGVDAHAWLVVGMSKTTNGYKLEVVDSNYRNVKTHYYKFGDTRFEYGYMGRFVPRTGKKRELRSLEKKVKKFCKNITN